MEAIEKSYPKVLVVSHNVLSSSTNMGKTLLNFFAGWDTGKIAQLYFHNEVPTDSRCVSYFRITDFDMLKLRPGVIFDKTMIDSSRVFARIDTDVQSKFYQIGARRRPYVYFFRNLLWRIRKWKTKELMSWIAEYEPDVVFYAAGDYVFSQKIALIISQESNTPLVVYFGDDFYFLERLFKRSLFERSNRGQFRRQFEELFSYLSTYTAATDKLCEEYSKNFGKDGYAILNSMEVRECDERAEVVKVSYIGNITLNRWKALIDIGRCLKELGFVLDVYSMEKDPAYLSQLTFDNGIRFQGGIPSHRVAEVIKASTVVVHVEAMDEIGNRLTKYSLSTKIGESLGSGVCLFAYGPADVASIEYLAQNDVACVCSEESELKGKLAGILEDAELREHYVRNACELAAVRHDLRKNAELFYEMICGVVG